MVHCKAMILIGALLLVPTFSKRIQQMFEPMPDELEEMMEREIDHTMEQMDEQEQEEVGQALVEEVVEKPAADEVAAAVREAFVPGISETDAMPAEKARNAKFRRSHERKVDYFAAKDKAKIEMMDFPRAPPTSPAVRDSIGLSKAGVTEKVAAPRSDTDVDPSSSSSSSSGEDPTDGAEQMPDAEPVAELASRDELAAEDLRRVLDIIKQGREKQVEGKNKGKVKVKGKYLRKMQPNSRERQRQGKDAPKAKEYRLVKGNANKKTKGERQFELILEGAEETQQSRFRFPVWGGSWWLTRLAFQRGPFHGFIYQELPGSKTLLVRAWKTLEDFGGEAIIPLAFNHARAKVGDKITFDVQELAQEGEGMPRPMAKNVMIRQRGHAIGDAPVKSPTLTDVRSQVLYYVSDDNLRRDRFFQDIIATTEGGWISIDFFLLCPRLKQLGASTKSVIKSIRGAPGIEIRDIPSEEAIRRTSPPPSLKRTGRSGVARQSLADAMSVLTKVPVSAKKIYSKEFMKNVLRLEVEKTMEQLFGENREELARAEGPEADELRRAIAAAGPAEAVKKIRRGGKTWRDEKKAMEGAKQVAADKDEEEKIVAQTLTEKSDSAVAEQVAADRAETGPAKKTAAKKGGAKAGPAAVKKEKASKEAEANETEAADQTAAEKADGAAGHATDIANVEDSKGEKAKQGSKKVAAKKVSARRAALEVQENDILDDAEQLEEEKAFSEAVSAAVEAVEAAAADDAGVDEAVAEMAELAVKEAAAATAAETAESLSLGVPAATSYNKVSWRSWFSLLPSSAWGYLRLHGDDLDAQMSRILLDEENNRGEQDADNVGEQQDKQDAHKKRRWAEAQKEQRAIVRALARARKPSEPEEVAVAREEE